VKPAFFVTCLLLCCSAWAGDTAFTVRPTELKAKPHSDAATLVNLSERSTVEVLLRQFSWMQVKAAAGVGWVKMLSLRLGSQDAPTRRAEPGTNDLFEVASKGRSVSNTGTLAKGLHVNGGKANVAELNPDQPDVIQADEIYESDQPDDTYDGVTVVPTAMWGGAAGKLRNAHPEPKAWESTKSFAISRPETEKAAVAAKLVRQQVDYLEANQGVAATETGDLALETALGRSMTASVLSVGTPVQAGKLQQYVNSVGLWLALQSERPDLPWQFVVLESEELFVFPVPGGTVIVSRGLLKRVHSEEELAGVLGQAIAHIVRQHHYWAIKKRAGTHLLAALKDELDQKASDTPTLSKLTDFGLELLAQGLKTPLELEADRMAVVLAARSGYDPYGLPSVLQTLQTAGPKDPNLAWMRKTHPTPFERLDALDKSMTGALNYAENQPNLASRFKLAFAEVTKP
jgi:hypothetical protein